MSRDTGIPYMAIYYSLRSKTRERPLSIDEGISICKFLGVNPMDFADESEKEVGTWKR